MGHAELLRLLVEVLERLGLRYVVTGSVATIFYGEPRFTNDIDVVVELPRPSVHDFCVAFPEDGFYVSEEAALAAVEGLGQFNVIHPASGLKIDVIVAKGDDFDRGRLERARRVRPAADFEASFATPEDVIVRKLQYYAEGGSDKHLRDIAGVLKVCGDSVDLDYVTRWAANFGVAELWREVLVKVGAGTPQARRPRGR
jgi:hypothetical protein